MMAPVAQEHAGLAPVFLGSGDEPINKSLTVLVMQGTVGLQSKVYVCENYSFFKQVVHVSYIPWPWPYLRVRVRSFDSF